MHLATPCTVWSSARQGIRNHAKTREKERVGVDLVLFSVEVIKQCLRHHVLFSLENPRSSKLSSCRPVADIMQLSEVFAVDFAMCMYGESYQKKTRFTNCFVLTSLALLCCYQSHAVVLEGTVKILEGDHGKYVSRTAVAGRYPEELCLEWSRLLKSVAPAGACTVERF